ncbi:MAG: hypothetical protein JWO69_797 [Thermoleophilia bacterium]|jgi:hypothetical protein|nr:hypothetical protein [Thermoleophilia bacterium]
MMVGTDDVGYHTVHAWPVTQYDWASHPLSSFSYSFQRVKVRVLDDDGATHKSFFVRAYGHRSFDSSVPEGRLTVHFGCTRQKRTHKRTTWQREWSPTPVSMYRGRPVTGYQATPLVRGVKGPWRTLSKWRRLHFSQDVVPNYGYRNSEVRSLPKWVKSARVTCDVPRGTPSFSTTVPLYRAGPLV